MKQIIKEEMTLPYSLHDATISHIDYQKDIVTLNFKEGFYSTDDETVNGSVVIDNVLEGNVMLYNSQGRKIKGEKLSLKKFLKTYTNYEIEILEEAYSPTSIIFEGLIDVDDEDYNISIKIITNGHMSYVLGEVKEEAVKYEDHQFESPYNTWREKVLVKNTTFDERRKIVEESLGGDVTCSGDDVLASMYEDYIDGKIELHDINKEYMRQMGENN